MVTWNVADNSGMGGGFQPGALNKLLGIDLNAPDQVDQYFIISIKFQGFKCGLFQVLSLEILTGATISLFLSFLIH